MAIQVQETPFDVGDAFDAFTDGNTAIGGVCMFVGLVRDFQKTAADAQMVQAMTLEHYPGMTEKELARIEEEARTRWDLEDVMIIHRYGRMEPGENIVLVMAASAHRTEAFEAAQYMMDFLKTRATFWKLEETDGPDGARWVDARDSDTDALDKWKPQTDQVANP